MNPVVKILPTLTGKVSPATTSGDAFKIPISRWLLALNSLTSTISENLPDVSAITLTVYSGGIKMFFVGGHSSKANGLLLCTPNHVLQ